MQLVHERFGHAVAGSDLPIGQSLDGDGFDEHLVLGHCPRCPETSTRTSTIRPRCPVTCVHDVLKPDTTVTATMKAPNPLETLGCGAFVIPQNRSAVTHR